MDKDGATSTASDISQSQAVEMKCTHGEPASLLALSRVGDEDDGMTEAHPACSWQSDILLPGFVESEVRVEGVAFQSSHLEQLQEAAKKPPHQDPACLGSAGAEHFASRAMQKTCCFRGGCFFSWLFCESLYTRIAFVLGLWER